MSRSRKFQHLQLGTLLLFLLLAAAQRWGFEFTQPQASLTPTPPGSYVVSSIIDGDTIRVMIGDTEEPVRLVGIDTPETVDPRRPVECMGKEASERMRTLVENTSVLLAADASQTDRDKYGRLLRYVFLEDGTDVGFKLVEEGLAQSSNYGMLEHEHYAKYEEAEKMAKNASLGLWNNDTCPLTQQ